MVELCEEKELVFRQKFRVWLMLLLQENYSDYSRGKVAWTI